MVALVVNKTAPAGSIFADEALNPFWVIVRELYFTYFVLPTSVGVNHCKSPSQNDGSDVEGVPPPITSQRSLILHSFQLSLVNRKLGTLWKINHKKPSFLKCI